MISVIIINLLQMCASAAVLMGFLVIFIVVRVMEVENEYCDYSILADGAAVLWLEFISAGLMIPVGDALRSLDTSWLFRLKRVRHDQMDSFVLSISGSSIIIFYLLCILYYELGFFFVEKVKSMYKSAIENNAVKCMPPLEEDTDKDIPELEEEGQGVDN